MNEDKAGATLAGLCVGILLACVVRLPPYPWNWVIGGPVGLVAVLLALLLTASKGGGSGLAAAAAEIVVDAVIPASWSLVAGYLGTLIVLAIR